MMRTQQVERRLQARLLMALIAATTVLSAQDVKTPDTPAAELVRASVANEVAAASHPKSLHMFCSHKQTPKVSQTRLYVETTDALAAMLIAVNNKPLTDDQRKGETDHLAWLANTPEQLHKKHAREKEDEQRTLQIVKALPDAFLYEYAGTEDTENEKSEVAMGEAGHPLVKLNFKPNPDYSPPSRVEQVLAGMQGYLLVDAKARRIAKIDGTLAREVSFGWGIIGHLDKGGHFVVKQANLGLGDEEWGITEVSLNVTGKLLLFKSLNMVSDEALSDFRPVPEHLTFAQGVELLKSEQEKLARVQHQELQHTDQAQKDQPQTDQPKKDQSHKDPQHADQQTADPPAEAAGNQKVPQ